MLHISRYCSPLGEILLAEKDGFLAGLWFEKQKYFFGSLKGQTVYEETPVLIAAKRWLDRYFAGEKPSSSEIPLAPEGGEFRQTVWKILLDIPYGQTVTYGFIAKKTAEIKGVQSMSAQAVGGAVGHNPVSIIIPCHRVVGANGSLTGYAGGTDKKLRLLRHEGAVADLFQV